MTAIAEIARPGLRALPRATYRDNLVTALLGLGSGIGGFLDAWAHVNLGGLESFFTPWHAVLYGGWGATVGWIGLLIMRERALGRRGLAAVPIGYGLGLVGIAGLAAGGLADMVWHTFLGIEVGIEPLLSPPHLLLATGDLLLSSSVLRAVWSDPASPRAPSFPSIFPALLSLALCTSAITFFFQYQMAFVQIFPERDVALGIPTVLTTNLMLAGAMLLLLRRWHPPFGSCTLLFAFQAVLALMVFEFITWPTILPTIAGGLVADTVIQRLRPSYARPASIWAVSGLTALALWSAYMLTVWLMGRLDWSAPLWSGVITLAVGTSVALGLLVAPPEVPEGEGR
ncbi:MAG: hypothetical protein ACRDZO_24475 [Egibacteraceae bacterium]